MRASSPRASCSRCSPSTAAWFRDPGGEGQVVERDQLLLKIDETRATSGVRESAARASRCAGQAGAAARALAEGAAFVPPAGGRRRGDTHRRRRTAPLRDAPDRAGHAVGHQPPAAAAARAGTLRDARGARLGRAQLDLQPAGARQTRPLLASGAVSEVDILRLERDVARARRDRAGHGADRARAGRHRRSAAQDPGDRAHLPQRLARNLPMSSASSTR